MQGAQACPKQAAVAQIVGRVRLQEHDALGCRERTLPVFTPVITVLQIAEQPCQHLAAEGWRQVLRIRSFVVELVMEEGTALDAVEHTSVEEIEKEQALPVGAAHHEVAGQRRRLQRQSQLPTHVEQHQRQRDRQADAAFDDLGKVAVVRVVVRGRVPREALDLVQVVDNAPRLLGQGCRSHQLPARAGDQCVERANGLLDVDAAAVFPGNGKGGTDQIDLIVPTPDNLHEQLASRIDPFHDHSLVGGLQRPVSVAQNQA